MWTRSIELQLLLRPQPPPVIPTPRCQGSVLPSVLYCCAFTVAALCSVELELFCDRRRVVRAKPSAAVARAEPLAQQSQTRYQHCLQLDVVQLRPSSTESRGLLCGEAQQEQQHWPGIVHNATDAHSSMQTAT